MKTMFSAFLASEDTICC